MSSRVWVPGDGEDPFAKEPEGPDKPTAEEVAQARAALLNVDEDKRGRRAIGIVKTITKNWGEGGVEFQAFVRSLPGFPPEPAQIGKLGRW